MSQPPPPDTKDSKLDQTTTTTPDAKTTTNTTPHTNRRHKNTITAIALAATLLLCRADDDKQQQQQLLQQLHVQADAKTTSPAGLQDLNLNLGETLHGSGTEARRKQADRQWRNHLQLIYYDSTRAAIDPELPFTLLHGRAYDVNLDVLRFEAWPMLKNLLDAGDIEESAVIFRAIGEDGSVIPAAGDLERGMLSPDLVVGVSTWLLLDRVRKLEYPDAYDSLARAILDVLRNRHAVLPPMFLATHEAAGGTRASEAVGLSVPDGMARVSSVANVPRGWTLTYRRANPAMATYVREQPEDLWLYDSRTGLFKNFATEERREQPAFSAFSASVYAGRPAPRVHYAILHLERAEERAQHVHAQRALHPYIELFAALDGKRELDEVKREADRLGLGFARWKTFPGKLAQLVSQIKYMAWLYENRDKYDYGVLLQDDAIVPHDFRGRVEALAHEGSDSKRLGRLDTAIFFKVAEMPAMLELARAIPHRAGADIAFGVSQHGWNGTKFPVPVPLPFYTVNGDNFILPDIFPAGAFVVNERFSSTIQTDFDDFVVLGGRAYPFDEDDPLNDGVVHDTDYNMLVAQGREQ